MDLKKIVFSGHAVRRMFERQISKTYIQDIIIGGEIIKEYPEDKPFPSYLVLGYVKERPLHIVIAMNSLTETCYVITVYDPDPVNWKRNFKSRRKK